MNYKVMNRLVKYKGNIWMIDAVSDKGMATIYADGHVAIVPESELEFIKS